MPLNAIFGMIIVACWLVFIFYWIVTAIRANPNARRNNSMQWVIRALIAVIIIVHFLFGGAVQPLVSRLSNPILGVVGVALCVLGVALAIWARVYLGNNWGMPMTLKENPELVTNGPYSYVRHPIYTGMLLAMLGSALATSLLWLGVFRIVGRVFYLQRSARRKTHAQGISRRVFRICEPNEDADPIPALIKSGVGQMSAFGAKRSCRPLFRRLSAMHRSTGMTRENTVTQYGTDKEPSEAVPIARNTYCHARECGHPTGFLKRSWIPASRE